MGMYVSLFVCFPCSPTKRPSFFWPGPAAQRAAHRGDGGGPGGLHPGGSLQKFRTSSIGGCFFFLPSLQSEFISGNAGLVVWSEGDSFAYCCAR